MLEGLDNINWQRLESAYGRTNTIPNLIRRLTSPKYEIRQQAMEKLFEGIWYQEILYEATPFIIPFLIELLAHDTVQCKGPILSFLADLALRCSPPNDNGDVSGIQDEDPWPMNYPYNQEQIQNQFLLCRNVYEGIAQGKKDYSRLLASDDPEIRVFVPYLLDILEEYTGETISFSVLHLLEEKDERVKTSLLIYLGSQPEYSPEYKQMLEFLVKNQEENILVRVFAAISQISYMKKNIPQETIRVILDALIPSEEMQEMYRSLPWSLKLGNSIISVICISLLSFDCEAGEIFISRLLEALDYFDAHAPFRGAAHISDVCNIIHALLYFAFYGEALQINKIPFLLTNIQRRVLIAILASPLVINLNQHIAKLMDDLRFPFLWEMRLLLL